MERGDCDRRERRVADHLSRVAPQVGAGMDPVGFPVASHASWRGGSPKAGGRT